MANISTNFNTFAQQGLVTSSYDGSEFNFYTGIINLTTALNSAASSYIINTKMMTGTTNNGGVFFAAGDLSKTPYKLNTIDLTLNGTHYVAIGNMTGPITNGISGTLTEFYKETAGDYTYFKGALTKGNNAVSITTMLAAKYVSGGAKNYFQFDGVYGIDASTGIYTGNINKITVSDSVHTLSVTSLNLDANSFFNSDDDQGVLVFSGNDTITPSSSNVELMGFAGDDTFIAKYANITIDDLGNGNDILQVGANGTVNATIYASWTATKATVNNGVATTLNTAGYNVNLSAIKKGKGFTVTDSVGGATIVGSGFADILNGFSGDTLTGGLGADAFNVTNGTETITDLGNGADVLNVSVNSTVNATVVSKWKATSSSINNGVANLITTGYSVDLSSITLGSNGFSITNTGSATTLKGSKFNDVITGIAGDSMTGGAGADTFIITAGNNSVTKQLNITGYSASSGDIIKAADVVAANKTLTAATTVGAGWNVSSGFATKSGAKLADFLSMANGLNASSMAEKALGYSDGSNGYIYIWGETGSGETGHTSLVKLVGVKETTMSESSIHLG